MKKQTTIILVLVGFIFGVVAGFTGGKYVGGRELTRIWSHVVEGQLWSSSLWDVTYSHRALKLLKEGQAEKAEHFLQTTLHSALQTVDLLSENLHRPDMLTNADVVSATAFDKELGNSN
jgi:hypothetical protein